jgi:hypothetical protein
MVNSMFRLIEQQNGVVDQGPTSVDLAVEGLAAYSHTSAPR